jgi:hypothetical protein
MKMIDEGKKVIIELSYAEAEKLALVYRWGNIYPPKQAVETSAHKLLNKIIDKLDEYVNS